jgi:transaldolase
MNATLAYLTQAGVSLWLDDLDRSRLTSGNLAELISARSIRGVTTNPTIFHKAISTGGSLYANHIRELANLGHTPDEVVRALTTDDVRAACVLLEDIWRTSDGVDGRVSIEVDPRLAEDTQGTIHQAATLWDLVDRPNLLVKIPATTAGLPAITATLARGISVNVTLIFSVERYRQVLAAYADGLELARENGYSLPTIHSVASFFVSRVDTEVDARLAALGTADAAHLRGTAAIANAQLAWAAYQEFTGSPRWRALVRDGAREQRPLWASTGVKDPAFDDTRYVVELVAPGTVNTMPQATLDAVADHGAFRGDTLIGTRAEAERVWADLRRVGIDFDSVFQRLEQDGVEKFITSWNELLDTITQVMRASA